MTQTPTPPNDECLQWRNFEDHLLVLGLSFLEVRTVTYSHKLAQTRSSLGGR